MSLLNFMCQLLYLQLVAGLSININIVLLLLFMIFNVGIIKQLVHVIFTFIVGTSSFPG